ncbi:hypothetical protein F5Y09DRAFT_346491 [Xylaria sp. FL1042]|nr:hypothetical protein F5Y09DRAFT_346491 [Xylaria sp. FL1042]
MCYYQNIHFARHHVLLGFDAKEQERHSCAFKYPKYQGHGDDKCPLHSCCRVKRVVVLECGDSPGEAVEGLDRIVNSKDEKLCPVAYSEDVFVPLPVEEEQWPLTNSYETEGAQSGIEADHRADTIHKDEGINNDDHENRFGESVIMEFWSEDAQRVFFLAIPDGPDYQAWAPASTAVDRKTYLSILQKWWNKKK